MIEASTESTLRWIWLYEKDDRQREVQVDGGKWRGELKDWMIPLTLDASFYRWYEDSQYLSFTHGMISSLLPSIANFRRLK